MVLGFGRVFETTDRFEILHFSSSSVLPTLRPAIPKSLIVSQNLPELQNQQVKHSAKMNFFELLLFSLIVVLCQQFVFAFKEGKSIFRSFRSIISNSHFDLLIGELAQILNPPLCMSLVLFFGHFAFRSHSRICMLFSQIFD